MGGNNLFKNNRNNNESNNKGSAVAVKPKKKKMNGALKALIIFLIVIFSIIILIVGGALAAGQYFASTYLKMSIFDCFGVISDIYSYEKVNLGTNLPTENDKKGFYSALDDTLFLKNGTINEETLSSIINATMSGDSNSEENNEENNPEDNQEKNAEDVSNTVYKKYVLKLTDAENTDPSEGSTLDIFADLINADNLDKEKIKPYVKNEYDVFAGSYDENFRLTFTDNQISAFFASMLTNIFDGLETEFDDALSNIVFERLKLYRTTEDVAAMEIIISINLKDTLASMISELGLGEFVNNLILNIVPEKIYANADLFLGEDKITARVGINTLSKDKIDRIYKLVDNAMAFAGQSSFSLENVINDTLNESAKDIIDTMDEMIGLRSGIQENELSFDIYSLIASAAFEEGVSGTEVAFLLVNALATEYKDFIEEYNDDLFYNNYLIDGNVVAIPAGDAEKEELLIDYKDQFVTEIQKKYLLSKDYYYEEGSDASVKYLTPFIFRSTADNTVYSQSDLKGSVAEGLISSGWKDSVTHDAIIKIYVNDKKNVKISIDDLDDIQKAAWQECNLIPTERYEMGFEDYASLFGLGDAPENANSVDFVSLFDLGGFKKTLDGKSTSDRDEWFVNLNDTDPDFVGSIQITDKMLAALIDMQLNSIMGETENSLQETLKLEFLKIYTEADSTVSVGKRVYMVLGLSVSIESMGDASFVSGILGERIGLTAKVDITTGLNLAPAENPDDTVTYEEYVPSEFTFNVVKSANSKKMLEILGNMGLGDISLSSLDDMLSVPIRDAMNQMNAVFAEDGANDGITFNNGELLIPDIYDTISTKIFPKDENKIFPESGEVVEIKGGDLRDVLKSLYNDPTKMAYSGTVDNMFYHPLVPGQAQTITFTDALFLSIEGATVSDGKIADVYEYEGSKYANDIAFAINLETFASDPSNSSFMFTNFIDIVGTTKISNEKSIVTYRFALADFMTFSSGAQSLLSDYVDINFVIDKTRTDDFAIMPDSTDTLKGYVTDIIINDMDAHTQETLDKIIFYLGESAYADYKEISSQVGVLFYLFDKAIENINNIPVIDIP